MYPDPTDVSKRKPRSIKGTPALKFNAIVGSSIFLVMFAARCLYTYAFTNPERAFDEAVEYEKQRDKERFYHQDFVIKALKRKEIHEEREIKTI